MTARDWMKDILLFSIVLAGAGAIAAFLMATDRVDVPVTFESANLNLNQILDASASLDQAIESKLVDLELQAAGPASELQVMRRLSLALTGTLPSVEEIREVAAVDESQRVHWYVSHLLEDKRCSDYLAERYARAFVGVEEGPFVVYRRRRFVSWLSDQLQTNTPYDEISRMVLTSNGLWTDSPEVNFYTYNIIPDGEDESKPDPVRLAGRTSRVFLGMRNKICLQCHKRFFGNYESGLSPRARGRIATSLSFVGILLFPS